jgi:hypothetical protein
MNIAEIVSQVLDDLATVATTTPNERLPKEEQLRCSVYAAMRPHFKVVCVERGYASIDEGSRTECDLWAHSPGKAPVWLEFKRCWFIKSVKGWNNKPPEQLACWQSDRNKLRRLPVESERYFLLVGCFDFDPLDDDASQYSRVIQNIRGFHAAHLVHRASRPFTWRPNDGISWVGAWVWRWASGAVVEGQA